MSEDFDPDATDMVTCEVTQERVPFDETVVIQGVRVSARGKQLLLDQLSTGHAIGDALEAPGNWRRWGCAILDGLVLGIPLGILGAVLESSLMKGTPADATVQGAIELMTVFVGLAYFTLMHASSGQTLGKMAGKFKVVKMDGSPINFTTAFIRAFAFNGLQVFPALVIMLGGFQAETIYNVLLGVVAIYGLANAITVLTNEDRRAIHDFIAGTRTVMIED